MVDIDLDDRLFVDRDGDAVAVADWPVGHAALGEIPALHDHLPNSYGAVLVLRHHPLPPVAYGEAMRSACCI
jgi:hypothetical protein